MSNPMQEYVERLEADSLRKVRAFAEIIHCVQTARKFNEPIDGNRILELAAAAAPYAKTRQPTNPSTLLSTAQLGGHDE